MGPSDNPRRTLAVVAMGVGLILSSPLGAQQTSRPMFLMGKVVIEGGAPLPQPALVKMRCQGGHEQPQGFTDPNGAFSFQIGQRRAQTPNDASLRAPATQETFGGPSAGQEQILGAAEVSLMGCVLRAALDGYTSSVIELSGRRTADDPHIGTIILSRVGGSVLPSVSLSSLTAPRKARQAYERGVTAIGRGQFGNAEKRFRKAVRIHPTYAEAWQELGVALQKQKKSQQAREAFAKAISINPNLPKAYLYLSLLTARARDWTDTAAYSDRLLDLEPEEYAEAYYYNAVAYYNLREEERALSSAEQAVKLDAEHKIPLAQQLLGILLARKGDFSRAADQFRGFIQHALPTMNLTPARQMLANAERGIAAVESARR